MTDHDYRHGQGAYVTAGPFKGALGSIVGTYEGAAGLEVGLSFTANTDKVDAWFRPSELAPVRAKGVMRDLSGAGGL